MEVNKKELTMCKRLGKKHRQYVGNVGMERLSKTPSDRNPKVMLAKTYLVNVLFTGTCLRDVLWNPQQNCKQGINKTTKPSKAKLYRKLERYETIARSGNY